MLASKENNFCTSDGIVNQASEMSRFFKFFGVVWKKALTCLESYELSSKSSGPITSRQNSGGSGGETSSSVTASTSSPMMSPEQLIDHIAKHQSYRMNDQRSEVNLLPGLFPSPRNQEVIGKFTFISLVKTVNNEINCSVIGFRGLIEVKDCDLKTNCCRKITKYWPKTA